MLGPVLDKNFRKFGYSLCVFWGPSFGHFLGIFVCQIFEILDAIVTRSAEFWIFWFRCLGAFFSRCFERVDDLSPVVTLCPVRLSQRCVVTYRVQ